VDNIETSESTNQSIAPSTGINDTEESIIGALKDNYDMFQKVANSIEGEPGKFSCSLSGYKSNPTFVIQIDQKDVDITSLSYGKEILDIINRLGFLAIIEYEDNIIFIKQGNTNEMGLMYRKDGKVIKDYNDSQTGASTFIQGNWYYYMNKHNY
jgi:hypothetical protein